MSYLKRFVTWTIWGIKWDYIFAQMLKEIVVGMMCICAAVAGYVFIPQYPGQLSAVLLGIALGDMLVYAVYVGLIAISENLLAPDEKAEPLHPTNEVIKL